MEIWALSVSGEWRRLGEWALASVAADVERESGGMSEREREEGNAVSNEYLDSVGGLGIEMEVENLSHSFCSNLLD